MNKTWKIFYRRKICFINYFCRAGGIKLLFIKPVYNLHERSLRQRRVDTNE